MSAKIGTIRTERNRAIQGQKDMRRTNMELVKRIEILESVLMLVGAMAETGEYGIANVVKEALK